MIELEADGGLGRLCKAGEDVVHAAPPFPGIERIEARFSGQAYARHRHDTYAVGVTLQGVQTFWYRGAERASMPGQVIILHPDEVHDGSAGDDRGLLYRMLYIEPAVLQAGLREGSGLPFVADPIVDDAALRASLLEILSDLDGELDALAADHFAASLADDLSRHSGVLTARHPLIDAAAITRARDFLDASTTEAVTSGDLETASGLDRFSLTRQFKALLGTSPHRYLLMRRLARGRHLLAAGESIAEAAAATGFFDQSHFHRHFLKAFGVTPGRWRNLAIR